MEKFEDLTEGEIAYLKEQIPRGKILKLIEVIELDSVKSVVYSNMYFNNITYRYLNSNYKKTIKQNFPKQFIDALNSCDEYEFKETHKGISISLFKVISEPIDIYHQRLFQQRHYHLKSFRIKSAWIKRKNTRKVLIEKNTNTQKKRKPRNSGKFWHTNYLEVNYGHTEELPF